MTTPKPYQPVTPETNQTDETHHTTPLARAFSAEIRAELARRSPTISGLKLAGLVGMSQNYIAKRLRDELPFTLDDIAAICAALDEPFCELAQRATDALGH